MIDTVNLSPRDLPEWLKASIRLPIRDCINSQNVVSLRNPEIHCE
jgi:hypothetical protein